MAPNNILIIGGGITGAVCSSILRKALPEAKITIFEKARGSGGRMSTTREGGAQVDLGAQFLSISKSDMEENKSIYDSFFLNNLLKPLDIQIEGFVKSSNPDICHYIAQKGMSSLVKQFLSDIDKGDVKFNSRISCINLEHGQYSLSVENCDEVEKADVVISTIPVPQFLELEGSKYFTSSFKDLQNVKYSTRFVLVWYYTTGEEFTYPSWAAKYLDDEIFRYVAIDNKKRGCDDPPAVIFHTNTEYGCKNEKKSKEEVAVELETAARNLFPHWPESAVTKCHKWKYSQVKTLYQDGPGFLILKDKPLLILAGDAFSNPNINGAAKSGKLAAQAVLNHLNC